MAKKKKYPIGKSPRAKVSASKEVFEIPSDVEAQLSENYEGRSKDFYKGREVK